MRRSLCLVLLAGVVALAVATPDARADDKPQPISPTVNDRNQRERLGYDKYDRYDPYDRNGWPDRYKFDQELERRGRPPIGGAPMGRQDYNPRRN